jgi:hypothetical protein
METPLKYSAPFTSISNRCRVLDVITKINLKKHYAVVSLKVNFPKVRRVRWIVGKMNCHVTAVRLSVIGFASRNRYFVVFVVVRV